MLIMIKIFKNECTYYFVKPQLSSEVSEEIIEYTHMFNKLMFENENEKISKSSQMALIVLIGYHSQADNGFSNHLKTSSSWNVMSCRFN